MNDDMVAHTAMHKGFHISVIYDYDVPNPRKEFPNLSTITIINGAGYYQGDLDLGPNDFKVSTPAEAISTQLPESDGFIEEDDFFEWDTKLTEKDYDEYLVEQFSDYAFVLPIHMQKHGTVNMYVGSKAELNIDTEFFISTPKHVAMQTWPQCANDPDRLEKVAIQHMKAEVETYMQWANGETYMYDIEDTKGYVDNDICGGFYGMGACVDGAKEAIDRWMWQERHENRFVYIRAGIHQKMITAKYLFFPTVVTTA